MPLEIQAARRGIIEELERNAKKEGLTFSDGPQTRLVDFRITPQDETEQKHLELTLGPIGWYDYWVVNEVYVESLSQTDVSRFDRFVELDEVADGRIKTVKLTILFARISQS